MRHPSAVPFARRLQDVQKLHARGDVTAALRGYEELNRERPDNPIVLHGMGVALAQSGRLADAEAMLQRAVQREPRCADFRFDLAALREAQGRPADAEAILRELVALQPDYERAWTAIAMYRRAVGDHEGAARAAAHQTPGSDNVVASLIQAARKLPPEEGAALLMEAIPRHPDQPGLLIPLAEILIRSDALDDAESVLRLYLGKEPDSAVVQGLLGGVLLRQRRFPEALAALDRALAIDVDNPDAWQLLSRARESVGDYDGARVAIGRAIQLVPTSIPLVASRARLEQQAGRVAQAQDEIERLPKVLRSSAEVRLVSGMLLPPIAESSEQIDALRDRWMETMADVEANPTFIERPWETVGLGGFFLGYHGREDRPLMEAFARASLAASPHLAYETKVLGGSGERRLRVGFVSANLRRHTVGRLFSGLMGALDRERFEVHLFSFPNYTADGLEEVEASADRAHRLHLDLEAARTAIEAERLDALIFTDLHMTPIVDALSYSRLAPVQAATWGHPGTSGRTTIDYWLSAERFELPDADRLYTERLVRLPKPAFVFARPKPPVQAKSRASFGLRADVRLYGSLQTLFKFHPDMDEVFAAILDADPKGRIVLMAGKSPLWREQLRARFARSFDPDRVDFLPEMPHADYLSAILACDVLLDPVHFSGGNTTLEAFALGKPVVTLRGDQMRNRLTGALYHQIGYQTLVAGDPTQYVQLANRLADDSAFAREAREAILAGGSVLFDNVEPVRGFEDWLLSVRR